MPGRLACLTITELYLEEITFDYLGTSMHITSMHRIIDVMNNNIDAHDMLIILTYHIDASLYLASHIC